MKKWIAVGLLIAGLAEGTAARAQFAGYPGAPMADPALAGGPMAAPCAPPASPDCPPSQLSLPPDLPNAFSPRQPTRSGAGQDLFDDGTGWYVSAGAIALRRPHLGHLPLAVFDPGGGDTGVAPPPDSPLAVDLKDLVPKLASGSQNTIGYQWYGGAVEASNFYIYHTESARTLAAPGLLDAFFFNAPPGFEGDNGLFLQADRMHTSFRTALASAEINFKWWSQAFRGAKLITGVRYIDEKEKLQIVTDDDGLTLPPPIDNGDGTFTQLPPNGNLVAAYTVQVHNHIVAPQLGFEYELCVFNWMSLGCFGKGAGGVNFTDINISLAGPGGAGFSGSRSQTIFSQVYETGAFVDLFVGSRLRVRGGYTGLFLLHVPLAADQVNFDLSSTTGTHNNNGNIFYHGPTMEVQFRF